MHELLTGSICVASMCLLFNSGPSTQRKPLRKLPMLQNVFSEFPSRGALPTLFPDGFTAYLGGGLSIMSVLRSFRYCPPATRLSTKRAFDKFGLAQHGKCNLPKPQTCDSKTTTLKVCSAPQIKQKLFHGACLRNKCKHCRRCCGDSETFLTKFSGRQSGPTYSQFGFAAVLWTIRWKMGFLRKLPNNSYRKGLKALDLVSGANFRTGGRAADDKYTSCEGSQKDATNATQRSAAICGTMSLFPPVGQFK